MKRRNVDGITSLSIWPPQLKRSPSVDLSEKHRSALRRPDLIIPEDSSTLNGRLLEAYNDGETSYLCVNPYDVNPVSDGPTLLSDEVFVAPLEEELAISRGDYSTTNSRVFYGPSRIKLEMEKFGDISPYLLDLPMSTNSVDELNTPTFELKDFDFGLGNYETKLQPDTSVKVERDVSYRYSYASDKNKDIFIGTEVPRNASEIGNIDNVGNAAVLYSPPASDTGTYIYSETTTNRDSVNDCALSVDPEEGLGFFVRGLETPDDSDSSTGGSSERKMRLSLDIGGGIAAKENISTPNVLAGVVDLENGNFNILDLVKDDLSMVTSEDIFQTLPVSQPPTKKTSSAEFLSRVSGYEIPTKQPRKRRRQASDDDDYLPPSKKSNNIHQRKTRKILQEDSDSDSGSEYGNYKPRGRPAKRASSIASEGSRDGDGAKYRELRDKNNEASRKSRQKRKMKELELEKEAEELKSRNIKLKAQVEELEKMVNNFRDNLFKIMMVKK